MQDSAEPDYKTLRLKLNLNIRHVTSGTVKACLMIDDYQPRYKHDLDTRHTLSAPQVHTSNEVLLCPRIIMVKSPSKNLASFSAQQHPRSIAWLL